MKIEKLRQACFAFDADGNGFLTMEEFRLGLEWPDVAEVLEDIQLPTGSELDHFFALLDAGRRTTTGMSWR